MSRSESLPAVSALPSYGQLRSLLDRMAEGILSTTRDGRVLLANAAARRLLGLGNADVDAEWFWRWIQRANLEEVVRTVLSTGQVQVREVFLRLPEERTLQVQIMRGQDHAAEQTLSIVLHDVTELRHLERVRQDFVANVSHELRTPLTSIKGFIETFLQGAIDDPEHNRRFLTLVEEDVNRLARLTEDLLELSKVESFGKDLSFAKTPP